MSRLPFVASCLAIVRTLYGCPPATVRNRASPAGRGIDKDRDVIGGGGAGAIGRVERDVVHAQAEDDDSEIP